MVSLNDLLIATINRLVLWQNGTLTTISEGNYYGLSWDNDNVYCSKNEPHSPLSKIEVFNKNLERCRELSLMYTGGIHQILSHDGNLFITNTQQNQIDIYDGSQTTQKINWTDSNEDNHHINSVWIDGDRIYAVESGLHGKKYLPTIQVLNGQYEPIERILLPDAIHIHNVYIEDEILYCCGKFGLVRKELNTDQYSTIDLRIDKKNGFFRGFARSKDYFYIGESQILPREDRPYGDARIIILDNNLEIFDTIDLTETGQIQDLRIINADDLAHNRIIFNYRQSEKHDDPIKIS